jgi:hypothetical protein
MTRPDVHLGVSPIDVQSTEIPLNQFVCFELADGLDSVTTASMARRPFLVLSSSRTNVRATGVQEGKDVLDVLEPRTSSRGRSDSGVRRAPQLAVPSVIL